MTSLFRMLASLFRMGARETQADAAADAPANPATRYTRISELLMDPALTREQKLSLLDEWEEDTRLELVASEEGMNDGPTCVELGEILHARRVLSMEAPTRPQTPAKA